MKLLTLIFGGVGILLLVLAAVVFVVETAYLNRAKIAVGTVTELYKSIHDEGGSSYCPVFRFTTPDGKTVSYRGNVCASPPAYKIGDRAELYYDPQNINDVQMNDFWSEYTGIIVLVAIGVPFSMIGLYGLIAGGIRGYRRI